MQRRFPLVLMLAVMLPACGSLMFFPQRELVRTPADIGLAWRDVYMTAADGTALHGWWLDAVRTEATPEPRGTVFFLHGNAENISTHIASVHWLPAAGYQVLMLDYRGFGRSGGRARIPDVYQDIEAGFRWLDAEHAVADRPLFLLAQSIGAALGVYAVGSDPALAAKLDGVVVDSGIARFDWIARDVARKGWLTWPFQWPIGWSMPDGYDPVEVIGALSPVPVMVMHGSQDGIVPFRHGEALYAAASEPRELVRYDGPHIGAFGVPAMRERVLAFFHHAVQSTPP